MEVNWWNDSKATNAQAAEQALRAFKKIYWIAGGVAKAEGILCEGPFPSHTVFLRARRGDFDAVQTMYHDQGQMAMKLIGFDRGVTLTAGYRVPVRTPAHGTAYDIAGKNVANLGATREAMRVAARMAKPAALDPADRAQRIAAATQKALARAT